MKLIVGLGNPGPEYRNTKHNVGFMVIDEILKKLNLKLNKEKFKGAFVKNKDYIIAKPLTYMNLSGNFIKNIADYFNIETQNILIVYDDMDVEIGKFKLKENGNSGGQKGIQNIIQHFGNSINRIKIGIGRPKTNQAANYVLTPFSLLSKEKIIKTIEIASEIGIEFIKKEFSQIMSQKNYENN